MNDITKCAVRLEGLIAIFGNATNLSKKTPKVKRVWEIWCFVERAQNSDHRVRGMLVSHGRFPYLNQPCLTKTYNTIR
jgi:hypothetical protein